LAIADGGIGPVARSVSILDRPDAPRYARFPADAPARFLVTIDTEEEFVWGAPLRRDGHGLETIDRFARFIDFCAPFGVVPLFLIDHPIATAPATRAALGPALAAGKAEVGIHLHPWVNPPFEEEVSDFNSFAGNLPPQLECAKILALRDAIEANLGVAPRIYRAGRYGAGAETAAALREAGVAIDTSVRALFDYGSIDGPNFHDHPQRPYWLDHEGGLLEVPVTTVFTGPLARWGRAAYPRLWRAPWMRGVLASSGLLERIPLSPEGTTPAEAIRAIEAGLAQGLPLLVFSFHSPSLAPGNTPYIRSEADLAAFHDWWRAIFAHLAAKGVTATSVGELTALFDLNAPAAERDTATPVSGPTADPASGPTSGPASASASAGAAAAETNGERPLSREDHRANAHHARRRA
jgi:hypothetical protein